MKRRSVFKAIAASGLAAAIGMAAPAQAQDAKTYTIALIPGLTTDAFYITMRKGAQAAADALAVDLSQLDRGEDGVDANDRLAGDARPGERAGHLGSAQGRADRLVLEIDQMREQAGALGLGHDELDQRGAVDVPQQAGQRRSPRSAASASESAPGVCDATGAGGPSSPTRVRAGLSLPLARSASSAPSRSGSGDRTATGRP